VRHTSPPAHRPAQRRPGHLGADPVDLRRIDDRARPDRRDRPTSALHGIGSEQYVNAKPVRQLFKEPGFVEFAKAGDVDV
jgi:hypothetical protein